jgi:hypothetical protein
MPSWTKKKTKRTDKGEKGKRVRKGRMLVEIRKPFTQTVTDIAEEEAKDATEVINDLVREALISRHRWPPKGD